MKFSLFIFLSFPAFCLAQKKDTILKYLDANLQSTDQSRAEYFGLAIKQGSHWFLYALYSDTTPVVKAYYKDKQLKIKDGPYTVFYPKHIKAQEGYFSDNKMSRIWQSWYPNGQKKDSGLIKNNQLVGRFKEWHQNGTLSQDYYYEDESESSPYISNSLFGFKHGDFQSWYETGILESTGRYKNDRMEGEWKWFHPNGKPSTIEQYQNGKVISLKCLDTTGKETGDFCSLEKPAVLKGHGDYKQFIFENLSWPEEALKKKIEGVVKVKFTVTKNGELKNLILESDREILKKAVEDLFESMKEWYPAVSHNRIIDWEQEITVPFYIKN